MSRACFGSAVQQALAHLADDGLLAYPTETVWGLGACADRPLAIEALQDWKGRESDAPLAVLVSSLEVAVGVGCQADPQARRLAAAFWPGPLTLVLPCRARWAPGVARGDGALGLRCSPHPVAARLARAIAQAGLGPLTATSLNRSGQPPALDLHEARRLVGESSGDGASSGPRPGPLWLEALVGAPRDEAAGTTPSSVVDCTGETPKILREGAIAGELLEQTWMR